MKWRPPRCTRTDTLIPYTTHVRAVHSGFIWRTVVSLGRRILALRIKRRSEFGERHGCKAIVQKFFRIPQRIVERAIDDLLDRAIRVLALGADGKEVWAAHRPVHVEQRDRRKIAGDRPSAAMSLYRSDIARLAQTRHRTADHDRVRTQHFRDRLRGRWPIVLRHVQQHMKQDRKSTRLNPVTNAHLVCRLLLEKKNMYIISPD